MTLTKRFRRRLALLATTAFVVLAPSAAHADPITAVIVTAVNAIGGATVAAAVGNFLVSFGASIYATAASWALGKLSAPKVAAASQERQAQVTSLTLGEVPREMIVGRAATGGSLVDAYYYGGTNGTDWNLFVVALADHPCDALEGFYVNDTYVPYTGDGEVAGYNGQLKVYWRPGEADDVGFPVDIIGLGPATAPGNLLGVAKVVVAYKADAPDSKSPTWSAGRPQFLWVVRGIRVYDPREDDTMPGGEGPQRYNDRTTWTWSENAELCRYAFNRGAYAFNDWWDPNRLRVGRGLSEYEAPPAQIIAAANLCDELVDIGEGQTEPRYRVGGVIRANESFDRVEQMFADAMGGFIIQPEGGVAVDPGQAKTPVAQITDDDLLASLPISFTPFRSASDRVNTVIARYIEPSQKYADTAAGVMRDTDDIALDGGPLEEVLSLPLVPYRKQAERLAEYRRRQHRLERLASFTLGPRFAHLEEGDWIEWRSRRWGNQPVLFRITAYSLDMAWRNTLSVEETAFEVFGFGGTYTPIVDQEPSIPPGALALGDVEATAISLVGENEELIPAVQFDWATPVDSAVERIRAEIRRFGETEVASTSTDEVSAGVFIVTNGVPPAATIQARLVPLGVPGRGVVPSAWQTLSTADLVATDTKHVFGMKSEQVNQMLVDLTPIAETAEYIVAFTKATGPLVEGLKDAVAEARDEVRKGAYTTIKAAINAAVADDQQRDETYVRGEKPYLHALRQQQRTEDTLFDLTVLTATVGDNMATVADFMSAQVSINEATATTYEGLAASVGDNKATYDAFVEAQATLAEATTKALTTQASAISGVSSSLESFKLTQATKNEALASATETVSTNFGAFKGVVETNYASKAYADGAVSSYDLTLKSWNTSSDNPVYAAAGAAAETVSDVAGQLYGSAGLFANAGGAIAGVRVFASSGPTDKSAVLIQGDRLQIQAGSASATTGLAPFTFDAVSGTLFCQNITLQRGNIQGAAISTAVGFESTGSTVLSTAANMVGTGQAVNAGSGADIFVSPFLYAENSNGSTGQDVTVKIYKDGLLWRQRIFHINPANQGHIGWTSLDKGVTGSHTYSIYATATPGDGSDCRATAASLVLNALFNTGPGT